MKENSLFCFVGVVLEISTPMRWRDGGAVVSADLIRCLVAAFR